MALNFILALPFAYLSIQSGGQSPGGKFGQYPDAEKTADRMAELGSVLLRRLSAYQMAANAASTQYVSLALAFIRLLLRTFLPLAVLILFLKPCSFFLWRFLGWYVLSILAPRFLMWEAVRAPRYFKPPLKCSPPVKYRSRLRLILRHFQLYTDFTPFVKSFFIFF